MDATALPAKKEEHKGGTIRCMRAEWSQVSPMSCRTSDPPWLVCQLQPFLKSKI